MVVNKTSLLFKAYLAQQAAMEDLINRINELAPPGTEIIHTHGNRHEDSELNRGIVVRKIQMFTNATPELYLKNPATGKHKGVPLGHVIGIVQEGVVLPTANFYYSRQMQLPF